MMMLNGGLIEGGGRRRRLKFAHIFLEDERVIVFILVSRLCGHSSKHLTWRKIGMHHQS
jgi:hypothetical protein